MTLPASGNITIGMVAAELGVSLPLSLGDSRVRALAGIPSGNISLSNLYGKSAYTPMTGTGEGVSLFFDSTESSGTAYGQPSVNVSNGSGGYTYQWEFTSNPNSFVLSYASSQTCAVSRAYAKNMNTTWSAILQCTVTDSTGRTLVISGISVSFEIGSNL